MSTVAGTLGIGGLLRGWRQRRRLSQLDLAIAADVSTRHLSFVETGRAKPSREFVIHLAEQLEVPLRERNSLLLAAGYAPVYRQTPLEADEMEPVRAALDKIVRAHQPFPALVVDRRWDLVTANDAALDVLTERVPAPLLAAPANALRISLHPDGMAPRIVNFAEWARHILDRLDRQIAVSADPDLRALAEELRTYPGVMSSQPSDELASRLFVPLVLRHNRRELTLFSTIATFGTALDITVAELSIESFFPGDAATAEVLASLNPTVPR